MASDSHSLCIAIIFICIAVIRSEDQGANRKYKRSYYPGTGCSETIRVSETAIIGGRLTSPNYPSRYPNSATCAQNLIAPSGYKIHIFFTAFDLEIGRGAACAYDSLQFAEAGGQQSLRYCGARIPPTFESNTNVVNITFQTDSSVGGDGYDLTYLFTDQRCGGTVKAIIGTITSPNYPESYPQNVRCTWILRVNKGKAIKVRVLSLALATEQDEPCSNSTDSLSIYKGETTDSINLVRMYCTSGIQTMPITMTIQSSSVSVMFISDDRPGNGVGFRLKFEQVDSEPALIYPGTE